MKTNNANVIFECHTTVLCEHKVTTAYADCKFKGHYRCRSTMAKINALITELEKVTGLDVELNPREEEVIKMTNFENGGLRPMEGGDGINI